MSVERDKNVARIGCVSREVQQPLLQDSTPVEKEKQFLEKAVSFEAYTSQTLS